MTDVKESSDDKPFRGPPEESLSGAPSEGTRVNDFLDYVDYTAEWPAKPHVHPVEVEVQRKVAQIRDDMKEMHIRLNEVVQMVASERIPSPRPDLIRQIRLLRISMILETVMDCLAVKNFYLAMKEAKRALKLAQELDDKLTISRCYYWMGRTEFMRGNIPAAHAYFKHALPCVEDDECVEGDFAGFWFKASRSGISEPYRKRVVADHNSYVIDKYGKPKPPPGSGSALGEKRKHQRSFEVVLRPRTTQNSLHQGQATRSSGKDNTRLVPWVIPEIDIEPRDKPVHLRRRFSGPVEREWHPAQSYPPLPWRAFTFRCYPTGLSPRIRPTEIFRPHPWEIIYTEKYWEKLRQYAIDKKVTMSWLAKERKWHGKIIYKRLMDCKREMNKEC